MENNLLRNFLTIEDFRKERPRMSIMNDQEIQEALNISTTMLDGVCNGLISLVVQYALTKETKDPNDVLYRTDFELSQLKNAIVFQTHYVLNLGNDFTIGSNSASTGGINYSFQRPEGRQELAPGVKEFLSRARVYELTNIGFANQRLESAKPRLLECFLTKEDGDRAYVEKFQPKVPIGSIATIGDGHTLMWTNPQSTQWDVVNAKKILDVDGEYRAIDKVTNIAFFGKANDKAMTRQETYNAIWGAMWWQKDLTYPNEALVKYYDRDNNEVLTFKSLQDNNLNHDPLKDNKDNFWWKQVGSAENIDFDEIAKRIVESKELANKFSQANEELQNQLEALWEQIKDNPHLMKKFEELYDQLHSEINVVDTKLSGYAKKDEANTFTNKNTFENHQEPITLKGGPNRFITFKDGNDSEILRVGKTHLNNALIQGNSISINNEHSLIGFDNEKVEIKYKENSIRLNNDGAIFNIDGVSGNVDSNQFKLVNYTPTHDDSVVTKKYVDESKGTNIDTSNFAKLDGDNNFSGTTQSLHNLTATGDIQTIRWVNANGFLYRELPDSYTDKQLVPKAYVDQKGIVLFKRVSEMLSISKRDITHANSIYFIYELQMNSKNLMIPLDKPIPPGNYVVTISFISVQQKDTPSRRFGFQYTFTTTINTQASINDQLVVPLGSINYVWLFPWDLSPGSAGLFNTVFNYSVVVQGY